MKEEIKLRPEVQWFVEMMELVLRENDYKDGWAGRSLDNLLWRLCGKYEELESAIRRDFEITRKAVHVANFAMMIADRCGEEEV